MRRFLFLFWIMIIFSSISCKEAVHISSADQQVDGLGKITLSLSDIPVGITQVTAKLTREGYREKSILLRISDSSSTASGVFTNIDIGWWHLKVEAFDDQGYSRYRGERDINVLPGETSIVELELIPTTGNIEIKVHWGSGEGHIIRPDHTKWEWTRDDRGGGSQDKLIFSDSVVNILPVEHVHFVNRTINAGAATYRFKFKGSNFKFAWRLSLNDSIKGTVLILQKVPGGEFDFIHVRWYGFYYGWHNSNDAFGNRLIVNFDSSSWHSIQIKDSGNNLRFWFDGKELDFFTNRIPVEAFLSDLGKGGLGIGNDMQEVVMYKDMEVILNK